ncbi:MAG: hypothetical protein MG2_1678 [uncultured Candidatus Poseidoniales archaeon]|jgi:hypothetical protein|nr:MAG: hypothetical protein MG2_1678 [uncultured Candidatus Poseidoniales archaeon]
MEDVLGSVRQMKSLEDGFGVDKTKGHSALFGRLKPGAHIVHFLRLTHSEGHLGEEPLALLNNDGRTPP